MVFIFFEVFLTFFSGRPPNDDTFRLAAIIIPLHFLTMIITFVLMVIYVVYLFRTDRVAKESKALWAVVLILGNILSMPVFWYLYIWKKPPEGQAAG
jgi:lysylphosphatidylglycerol synthetase-like protein (DUF2156 family)